MTGTPAPWNNRRLRRILLTALVLGLALAIPAGASAPPLGHSAHPHAAKKTHKKKKKKHKTPTTTGGGGPSLSVVGFGMNHLYVANGSTLTNAADCSTMVQGNGSPYGPPQNVYVEAYVKATDIPADSPTQIGEDIPEDDDTVRMASASLPLSSPIPFSQAFGASTLGFGTPPGSQADIHRGGLFSTNDADGPSASDFDGTYTYEVSVDADGTTLESSATVTIDC